MNKTARRIKKGKLWVIGLTGSIGMGKSTVARMFARLGVPVCDSDILVHKLLATGGAAVERVALRFPATRSENGIDRTALGKEVFGNPQALKELEAILHPLVRSGQQRFIRKQAELGRKAVVLDIPLLFETSAEKRCDKVVVVHAPEFIQRQRVLIRPGMTREKFERILTRQLPTRIKCKKADLVIDTGLGKARTYAQVVLFVKSLSHTHKAR